MANEVPKYYYKGKNIYDAGSNAYVSASDWEKNWVGKPKQMIAAPADTTGSKISEQPAEQSEQLDSSASFNVPTPEKDFTELSPDSEKQLKEAETTYGAQRDIEKKQAGLTTKIAMGPIEAATKQETNARAWEQEKLGLGPFWDKRKIDAWQDQNAVFDANIKKQLETLVEEQNIAEEKADIDYYNEIQKTKSDLFTLQKDAITERWNQMKDIWTMQNQQKTQALDTAKYNLTVTKQNINQATDDINAIVKSNSGRGWNALTDTEKTALQNAADVIGIPVQSIANELSQKIVKITTTNNGYTRMFDAYGNLIKEIYTPKQDSTAKTPSVDWNKAVKAQAPWAFGMSDADFFKYLQSGTPPQEWVNMNGYISGMDMRSTAVGEGGYATKYSSGTPVSYGPNSKVVKDEWNKEREEILVNLYGTGKSSLIPNALQTKLLQKGLSLDTVNKMKDYFLQNYSVDQMAGMPGVTSDDVKAFKETSTSFDWATLGSMFGVDSGSAAAPIVNVEQPAISNAGGTDQPYINATQDSNPPS